MVAVPIGKGDKYPETKPRNTAKIVIICDSKPGKGDTDRDIVTDCQNTQTPFISIYFHLGANSTTVAIHAERRWHPCGECGPC